MILFALALSVLLGFAAIVIDLGLVFIEKQNFQTAVDAAALAAAQELPDTPAATKTALEYLNSNGYVDDEETDFEITFENSDQKININGSKKVDYTLAKVLGISDTTVYPVASAQGGGVGGAFNYTLFSGSTNKSLSMSGNHFEIGGSVHSNQKVELYCNMTRITGACEAVSTITAIGNNIRIGERFPNASVVDMPDFSEIAISQIQESGDVYNSSKTFSTNNVRFDKPTYVKGDLRFNCNTFMGKGIIIADGDITFSGNNLKIQNDEPVCFYSINGNINFYANSVTLDGIVYAPKGSVLFYGNEFTVNGRVVAKEVNLYCNKTEIFGGTDELSLLPSHGAKLVR